MQAVKYLHWLHAEAGLQWQEIAARLGVRPHEVSRWKDSKVRPGRMACKVIESVYIQVRSERNPN
jgi:DNA-binding transcriptional regulator YiaG